MKERFWGPVKSRGQKNHFLIMVWLTACLLSPGLQLRAQSADSNAVGDMGNPERIVFEGLKTFTAEQVRHGLWLNPEYLLESHPCAPMADYLAALQAEVKAGFENAGFPVTKVNASVDADNKHILVKVDEGPRCNCSEIRLVGTKTIPSAEFIRRLTNRPPASVRSEQTVSERIHALSSNSSQSRKPKVSWQQGEPANFHAEARKEIQQGVSDVLDDFGYFFAHTEVTIQPDLEQRTAALIIEVQEEGPRGTLDRIDVTGLKLNRKENLLKYLGLKPGVALNRELIKQTELKLWHSGRFLNFKVSPEILEDSDNRLGLKIELTEHPNMPALKQSLSRPAQTLVKLSDWLSNLSDSGEDIVLWFNTPSMFTNNLLGQSVLSTNGFLLALREGTNQSTSELRYAAVISPVKVGLYDFARASKLEFSPARAKMQLKAFGSILQDPEAKAEPRFNVSFGAGFNQDEDAGALRLDTLAAPVALVDQVYRRKDTARFRKGVLTLESENYRIEVEEQTGRLLGFAPTVKDGRVTEGRLEQGAFSRTVAGVLMAGAAHRNFANSSAPTDIVTFALEEVLGADIFKAVLFKNLAKEKRERAVAALDKLLQSDVLQPIDKMLAQNSITNGQDFCIPLESSTPVSSVQNLLSSVAAWVFQYSKGLVPGSSWPGVLMREAVLIAGNRTKYTGAALQEIYQSQDAGPLGFAAIAHTLALIKSPAQFQFANRGLVLLTAADFRKDWELALAQEGPLKECCTRLAHALVELGDADIDALAALLSEENAGYFRRGVKLLRERRDQSIAETLAPVLNDYWEGSLKAKIRADLRKLASPAPVAEADKSK